MNPTTDHPMLDLRCEEPDARERRIAAAVCQYVIGVGPVWVPVETITTSLDFLEVLLRRQEMGWTCELSPSAPVRLYHVTCYDAAGEGHSADAPTLPIAVCLALLRAHGVTVLL